MGLLGRWMSERDMRFIHSINAELLGEMIQTEVFLYKLAPDITNTNIYGESKPEEGKMFYPGIEMTCHIDRAEIGTEQDDFGPTRKQDVVFKFREKMLRLVNFFPEVGDIIEFNARYHEIDNVVQEQFLGGIPEKSFSIIVNTHYSRLSKLNVVKRQT
jgi:hypothetical protein